MEYSISVLEFLLILASHLICRMCCGWQWHIRNIHSFQQYMTRSLVRYGQSFSRHILLSLGHISDISPSSVTYSLYDMIYDMIFHMITLPWRIHYMIWCDLMWRDVMWHGMAWHDMTLHDMIQDKSRQCIAWHGTTWHDMFKDIKVIRECDKAAFNYFIMRLLYWTGTFNSLASGKRPVWN